MSARQLFVVRRRWARLLWLAGMVLALAGRVAAVEKITLPDFLLRSWDNSDGLPAGNIRAVAQTGDGYLWVATTRGLARFDGVRFVVLTTNNTPKLGDNRITSLLYSRTGDLWVGTESGVVVRQTGANLAACPPLPLAGKVTVNTLAEDGEGALWVGTRGGGILRWRQHQWNLYSQSNGLPANGALQMAADKQGRIWAISGGKLLTFANERWESLNEFSALQRPALTLTPARDGGMWVATAAQNSGNMGSRVFKIKDGHVLEDPAPYPWPQNTFHTEPRVLFEDAAGRLWVGLATAGIYYHETGGQWQLFVPPAVFSQILVNCLAEDDAGHLWVGLDGAQLDQVRPRPVRTLHLPEPAGQNVVRMACAARDGSMWVGTDGAGVFRYQDGKWTHYGSEEGLKNTYIGVILEDSRTNLWVGTWNGLFRLGESKFAAALALTNGQIAARALCEDRKHNLWVGTSAGVVRLLGDQSRVYTGDASYTGGEVMAIAEDAAGAIWAVLLNRGVFRLNGERFEHVASPWLRRAEICSLLADANGGLWLGSLDNGIALLKGAEKFFWTSQDGLPSDMVFALMEDSAGNLWCGSDNGIIGCSKTQLLDYRRGSSPPFLCRQLAVADGLDSRRCSGTGQPVASRSADGRLWFPDSHALAVFDPARLPQDKLLHAPVVEEAWVDNERVLPAADGGLRVSSSARRYEFYYTLPKLQVPERLRFRFQLANWDADWVDAGQRRVAYYNHLPPGKYQFRVLAGGPAGEWREAQTGLRVLVLPRFWERRSLQVLGLIFLLGTVALAGWLLARVRLRERLRQLETRQMLERERRRIAQDLHDDIGAGVSQLIMLGEMAGRESVSDTEARRQLERMTDKSRELAQSMDETIWALNPRNDTLTGLVGYLQYFATEFLDTARIRCRAEVPAGLPDVRVEVPMRHNVLLASKEALHNVAAHSGAQEVWLRFHYAPGTLTIVVEDNGRGFDPAQSSGVRNGLENMRLRLEGMGGTFTVESQPGCGCCVRFTLPLDGAAKITGLGDGAKREPGSK